MRLLLDFHGEGEGGSDVGGGVESDLAFKQIDDLVRDDEAEPNAIRVHLLVVFDEAEEFEELVLVLIFDTDASVNY